MKKLILGLLAASTLASALPAAATPYGPVRPDLPIVSVSYSPFAARENADQRRILWCVHTHRMSRLTGAALLRELRAIRILERRLSVGGLTGWERALIARRLAVLEMRIRAACNHFVPPHFDRFEQAPRIPHPDPGPIRGHDRFERRLAE